MWKIVSALALILFGVASPAPAGSAETAREYSVQVSASVQTRPPRITLDWPRDSVAPALNYSVSRKAPGDKDWGAAIKLPGDATKWVDDNVCVGGAYEYQIVKTTARYEGYGYIYSGIEVPATEHRGTLLLIVDETYAADLAPELAQLEEDLAGDGWVVNRFDVSRSESVFRVKELIRRRYEAEPNEVKCVFLFGHVPVPYSGNIAPDGHGPDHLGAWPCDGYYGDMDGTWTDVLISETRAVDARNRNVPGDGKFDQSEFPASLKLMVGRVDLANMPGRQTVDGPPTFPNELELLRNYLKKDHSFRMGQMTVPSRGILGDNFGTHDGEAFAASGWRNFATFFGSGKVTSLSGPESWISSLSKNPCLWAYVCGPGTYESIDALGTPFHRAGTTAELVKSDARAVFVMLYGSWLGDWDSEDDLLRSVLAMPTCGLASAWSGRPHWFLQHMALGEPIGFGARLTQNNGVSGLYHTQVNSAAGQIHIALMGDPTLRLSMPPPPTELTLTTNTPSSVTLHWTGSTNDIIGYHVYKQAGSTGPFLRLTSSPVRGTSYTDLTQASSAEARYMVRTLRLETSASGTYFNLSQGAFLSQAVGQPLARLSAKPSTLEEPRANSRLRKEADTLENPNSSSVQ
jgi:hypothetical protein